MEDVFIVEAARSPIGKFMGVLSDIDAPHLGAEVVKGMMLRTKIDSSKIDEVIVGNVISAGIGQNPAKQVVVYSSLSSGIPAFSVNKVCASGLKAVSLGAESISSGNAGMVVAGGIESMSNSPFIIKGIRRLQKFGNVRMDAFLEKAKQNGIGAERLELVDEMIDAGLLDCYSNLHMGAIAEDLAGRYAVSREEQDEFALGSHVKAAKAADDGRFKKEIIPIKTSDGQAVSADEGIRRDTSMEKLAALKPAFKEKGNVTAGNSSRLSDGAAFILLMSKAMLDESGLKPLAKIESYSSSGIDPSMYGMAPVSAVKKALKKSGMGIEDVDLIELNEAFCVQALSVVKALGIDKEKLNVNGGATALGHPIGATGARILATLAYALHDYNKDVGIATLCHGGGGAMAMVIRRV
jgi:acetyl-CoA C-acetyltransferase